MDLYYTDQFSLWDLVHKTFFYVIYSKMTVNYGIVEIMTKVVVKIWL